MDYVFIKEEEKQTFRSIFLLAASLTIHWKNLFFAYFLLSDEWCRESKAIT